MGRFDTGYESIFLIANDFSVKDDFFLAPFFGEQSDPEKHRPSLAKNL